MGVLLSRFAVSGVSFSNGSFYRTLEGGYHPLAPTGVALISVTIGVGARSASRLGVGRVPIGDGVHREWF